MPIIKILPEHEARKIAAGEVVERPASVVKELLENALDAQVTEISIALHDGGKKRIRITDNGCGMSPEDALLSIEHHATSKICSVDELTFISTFGFRGEALSSIASVSDMRITTRRQEDECGFELFIQQGTCQAGRSIAAPIGTTIVIEDLFLNVPARRKFLKQRDTEWRAIHQLVTAYALAFPQIGFTLYHEDTLIYTAPRVTTLLERAQQLFPSDVAMHLVPCEYTTGNVSISGVMSTHQVTRYDRKSIFSFVNQRWVKNHVLGKAIIAGYENMLPHNKYPVAALSITLPKEQVDINVHPRKEEVLLMHPQIVGTAIAQAVQKALSQRVAQVLSNPHPFDTKLLRNFTQGERVFESNPFEIPIPPVEVAASKQEMGNLNPVSVQGYGGQESYKIGEARRSPLAETGCGLELQSQQLNSVITPSYDILGQLDATYILLGTPQGLMILDQHAAHEAIVYNQLQEQSTALLTSTLLFPECIPFQQEDVSYLPDVVQYLGELGIAGELWGDRNIMITGSPIILQNVPLADIINLILEHVRETLRKSAECTSFPALRSLGEGGSEVWGAYAQEEFKKQMYHKLYAMVACKKAVKAGDVLSLDEMKTLVVSFMTAERLLHCPHGRPTSWLIGLHDLEKWFQRKK